MWNVQLQCRSCPVHAVGRVQDQMRADPRLCVGCLLSGLVCRTNRCLLGAVHVDPNAVLWGAQLDSKTRCRMLGNIEFLGQLYMKKLVPCDILHACIVKLLGEVRGTVMARITHM